MPKNRIPPLADWEVAFVAGAFLAGAAFPPGPLTVRATYLRLRDGSYVLEDTFGSPLFSAPRECVLYVRRTEPGQEVPAAQEVPPGHVHPAGAKAPSGPELLKHMAEAHHHHFTEGTSDEDVTQFHDGWHGRKPPAGAPEDERKGIPSSDPPMDALPPAIPSPARRKRSGTHS